jgi:putative zinc finger protein
MVAMTCQEIRELFSARVDDALDADERARLDAHLATCAECTREWQGFERTVGLLRAVAPARAPAGFVDRVLAARPRPWYRRLARGLFLPWAVKLPLEAAAIVLVAGLAVLVFQRSPELQQGARIAEPPAAVTAPGPARPAETKEQKSGEASTPASRERPAAIEESKRHNRGASPTDVRQESERDAPAIAAPPRLDAPATSAPAAQPPAPEPSRLGDQRGAPEAFGTVGPPASATSPAPAERPLKAEGRLKSAGDVTAEKKDAEGERAAAAARQVAPAAPSALQKAGEVQRLAAALEVQARLAVAEPAAAERAVRDLVTRAGGHVLARVEDHGAVLLILSVSGDRWDETQRGLQTLGTLRLEGRSPDAGSVLRISLRLER